MKKAKLMILLYLLHVHFDVSQRGKSKTYAALYASLPLAHSTIRGIVQEFIYDQLVRRVYGEGSEGFILTSHGIETCTELFSSLFVANTTEATLCISQSAPRNFDTSLYIQLDSKTYYFFENINQRQRERQILLLQMSANQKKIVEHWFRLKSGKENLALREKILRLLLQRSRQKMHTSPISNSVRLLEKNILMAIISAARTNVGVPEEYYPHEMRLTSLMRQFWRA